MVKRILAVDDSASVRQMVSLTLSEAGYEVLEAVDGEDALSKLDGLHVDMVITDLNMPRLDGMEFVRRVRTMPKHRFMPIVMLTTESAPEKKELCRSAGATGWIVKPFRPNQLLSVVEKVIK